MPEKISGHPPDAVILFRPSEKNRSKRRQYSSQYIEIAAK
jgi:hypothetical protein